MCGLAGYVEREPLAQDARERLTNELLKRIDHRGGDATGLLALTTTSEPWLLKAPLRADRFAAGRPTLPGATRAVIGHTRFATQGDAAWGFNNHPVRVGDTYLAHNGHVSNQSEVANLGYRPMAEVDSALLAALVDAQPDPVAALDLMHQVKGSAAVTYTNPVKAPGVVVLARVYSSPLYVWNGRKAVVWASTPEAIIGAWSATFQGAPPVASKVTALAEGEAVVIAPDGSLTLRPFKRPPDPWSGYRAGGYRPWEAPVKATPPAKAGGSRKARKAARKARGKGAATAAPAPSYDVMVWADDILLAEGEAKGMCVCDSCHDLYTRTVRVDIGGEAFQMCASCASWAQGAVGQG